MYTRRIFQYLYMNSCTHICVCVRVCVYVCMCVCMCVYVCVDVCTHVWTYAHIHIFLLLHLSQGPSPPSGVSLSNSLIDARTSTQTRVNIYSSQCSYPAHLDVYTYTYIYIYIYMYIHIYICPHKYLLIWMCTQTMNIHTTIYAHIYIYMCECMREPTLTHKYVFFSIHLVLHLVSPYRVYWQTHFHIRVRCVY